MSKYMNLQETSWMIHRTAKEKGFYDVEIDVNFILSKIALLHSECTEILEAVRKDRGSDTIMEEVADTFIRLADLVEAMKDGGIGTPSPAAAAATSTMRASTSARLCGSSMRRSVVQSSSAQRPL